MKRIVASVGLAALGASGIQTASAQALATPDTAKPWSIAAKLRGFYDDNPSTLPDSSHPEKTFGYEVSPSILLRWALEQSTISVSYQYSFIYYDHTPAGNLDKYDSIHNFNLEFDHSFSERYKIAVSDSFVVGQEPDLLRAGNTFNTFTRVAGSNIRNYGAIVFDATITPLWSAELGYDNAYWHYEDHGVTLDPFGNIIPSLAGLLNRIENGVRLEVKYLLEPETKLVAGYRFRDTSYTGDEPIGVLTVPAPRVVTSDDRNSRSHYLYAGADHTFNPDLTGSLRAGAQYIDFYNDPTTKSEWSPYATASLRYTYAPESFLEAGFSYDRNATDVFTVQGDSITTDAQSAVLYASVSHRLMPKVYGSLIGQFQDSKFKGGTVDNDTERYYLLGLNLEYRFNSHFSADLGYNYDKLDSDIGRGFDRNRVYIGATASY